MGDDLKLFGSPYILVDGDKYEVPLELPEFKRSDDYFDTANTGVLVDRPIKLFLRPELHHVSLRVILYKHTPYRKAKTLARRKNSTRRKRNARRKASGK